MGIGLRDIGQGIAAGLGTFGQIYGQHAADEEARKEREEVRAENRELADREFDARRADAAIRNNQMKQQTMMNRMKIDNETMVKQGIATKYDPELLVPTLNKHSNLGLAFRHNAERSDALTKRNATSEDANLKGKKGVAYDVGVWDTNADGTPKIGENGKKVFKEMPSSFKTKEWNTMDEYTTWYSELNNVDAMWARYANEQTGEMNYQNAVRMQTMKDGSTSGQADIGLTKQQTATSKATEGKIKAATKGLGKGTKGKTQASFTSVTGDQKDLTEPEIRVATANQKAFATDYPKITVQEAWRITDMNEDPDVAGVFQEDLDKAAGNPTAEQEMIKAYSSADVRLPKQFIVDALKEALKYKDAPAEKKESWFVREFVSRLPFVK